MEIVPILSTIILVGTVATFILAVAAYVLYKIREGGAASDNELAVHQQPHHVVMAVDNQGTMHSMGDSAPAENGSYYGQMMNTPVYAEANGMYGVPASASMENGGMDSSSQGRKQSAPLNTFFWNYSEHGLSPIDLQDEQRDERNSALNAESD